LPEAAYDFWARDGRDGEESPKRDTLAEGNAEVKYMADRFSAHGKTWVRACITLEWAVNERKVLRLLGGRLMPRRKPTPERKSRSGPTIAEGDRLGTRMTLRLDGVTTSALDALAARWGLVRSQVIAKVIREAAERCQRDSGAARINGDWLARVAKAATGQDDLPPAGRPTGRIIGQHFGRRAAVRGPAT